MGNQNSYRRHDPGPRSVGQPVNLCLETTPFPHYASLHADYGAGSGLRRIVQLLINRTSTSKTMAPTVEVTMALIGKPPTGGRRSTSHNQVPIYPPITPTMISPIRPKAVLFRTLAASQPAIAPMTSVTIKLSIAVSPRSRQRITGRMLTTQGGELRIFWAGASGQCIVRLPARLRYN